MLYFTRIEQQPKRKKAALCTKSDTFSASLGSPRGVVDEYTKAALLLYSVDATGTPCNPVRLVCWTLRVVQVFSRVCVKATLHSIFVWIR